MRKMIICCLVLLGTCGVKSIFAETQNLAINKRRVVYILSVQSEKKVDLDCNKKEDEKLTERMLLEVPGLQNLLTTAKENANCLGVLKYLKDVGLKSFTQRTKTGGFSLIESIDGPSSMTDSEFQVLIDARSLELAEQTFPKEDGWNNNGAYGIIISNEKLRKVLGVDCFFCKKDETK